jgi:hypothetical protein
MQLGNRNALPARFVSDSERPRIPVKEVRALFGKSTDRMNQGYLDASRYEQKENDGMFGQ